MYIQLRNVFKLVFLIHNETINHYISAHKMSQTTTYTVQIMLQGHFITKIFLAF